MASDYVADKLYQRLFTPRVLPEAEWKLAREDWIRVDTICALPWAGGILDVGSGDGTLGAMVASRNPAVTKLWGVEQDQAQVTKASDLWRGWPATWGTEWPDGRWLFDGAICAEVLEHLTPDDGGGLLELIHECLRKGAMLCVTVPYPDGSRQPFPGHVRRIYGADLWRDLEAAGFTVKGVRLINGDDLLPLWLMATGVVK